MSALWVAVVAINGALALVVFYSWLCSGPRELRPEVADEPGAEPAERGVNRGTVLTWSGMVLGVVATGGDQGGLVNMGLLVPAALLFGWGVRRWRRGAAEAAPQRVPVPELAIA